MFADIRFVGVFEIRKDSDLFFHAEIIRNVCCGSGQRRGSVRTRLELLDLPSRFAIIGDDSVTNIDHSMRILSDIVFVRYQYDGIPL